MHHTIRESSEANKWAAEYEFREFWCVHRKSLQIDKTLMYILYSCESMERTITLEEDQQPFVTSSEAATILGAKQVTVSQLCQHGKIAALKIANRWLIPRAAFEEFAKDYRPKRGRPRTKRKYTKRSPIWNAR